MDEYQIRKIEKEDFDRKYLYLLTHLTPFETNKISKEMFNIFINNLNENHQIYVIVQIEQNIIIGTITIIFEQKLIHIIGNVCHIEDVVVHPKFRGLKLSKLLLNKAIELAKHNEL